MSDNALPQNIRDLLQFIAEADDFVFVPRPSDPTKDPFAYMSYLGIKPWFAVDIIKTLREEECRSKDCGEPCDDPRIATKTMWRFVHHYVPYDNEPHEMFIKVAAQIVIHNSGCTNPKKVLVISFHEAEGE